MGKKLIKNEGKPPVKRLTYNQVFGLVKNSLLRRYDLIRSQLDQTHDINAECGYPDSISLAMYKEMYDRNGIAARVVEVWPDECFAEKVEIYETESREETEFEKAWKDLDLQFNLIHYMNRVDILSGIGTFGVLFFGIGDGKSLDKPVEGIDLRTGLATKQNKYPLLYVRAFDESLIQVNSNVTDVTHPRYGYPETYNIIFKSSVAGINDQQTVKVHWTRLVHIADNRESSEICGIPRQQKPWNDLLNIRKTLGGSAEMFWRGGFPGIAFQMNNGEGTIEVTDDAKDTMRDNIADYFAGLDRALLLDNVEAKPMAPQVADPKSHFETQIMSICATIGIPHRIFLGSEEAKMASTQDQKAWDRRIVRRQRTYLTPMLVRPIVDRLLAYGTLPVPAEGYKVYWPDRAALTAGEVAEVAKKETDAMASYITGGVSAIMTPRDWYTMILKKTEEEAAMIEENLVGSEPILPPEAAAPTEVPEGEVVPETE